MATLARRLDRHLLAFCAVLLLAAGLRLHGLDWDQGQHQHPDERHISDVLSDRLYFPPRHGLAGLFDPGASDLNPRSNDRASGRPRQFAYGSLPLLLTDVVACGAELLTGHTCRGDGQGTRYWTTYDHQYLVGRFLTVLADLALIVVTYALARRAFGAAAGLIAGAFLAVSVVNIQLAHFFATDTWSALFATAALWALYRAAERGPFADWRDWALAGVLTGASVASKLNTFVLVVPAAVALWYSLRGEMSDWPALGLRRAALLGLSTLAAFAILEPYALPAWSTYWRDFNEQAGIIGGSVDVPYTRQFTGALPVWHYAWNLWGYGLGVGLTGLGLAGLAASAWRVWRRRSAIDLLLLAWFLAYGIVINTVFAKFLRYTLPLAPVLAILGGALAARLLQRLGTGRQSLPLGEGQGEGIPVFPLPLGEGQGEGIQEDRATHASPLRSPRPGGLGGHAGPPLQSPPEPGGHIGPPLPPLDTRPRLPLPLGEGRGEGIARITHYASRLLPGRADQSSPASPLIPRLLVALALLAGLAQALAFSSIYRQPHSRVDASEWIYASVPPGSHIAVEAWDDSLPLPFRDGRNPGSRRYTFVDANHYHDRSAEEGLAEIERILFQSDYIVVASQRIFGSTGRMPWRYPIVNRYYDLLFAERLGYELAYYNEPQPLFGPLRLDSRFADESFSVYDHPPVRIYRKVADLSPEHLRALFDQALDQPPQVRRAPPQEKSLLLAEPLWSWPDLNGEAWAAPPGSSWLALAGWLLTLAALLLVGLPWAALLFRPLADGGLAFARVLALVGIGYLVWIGASLRWTTFSAGTVLAVTVLVGTTGWLLLARRPAVLGELRARRRAIVVAEGIFWAGFTIALLLRLANPDLWQPWLGGEKPMESAYLNAVLRSAYFPPYDPWFSGGHINYYYYGFVLIGVPIKLAGVAPAIAFNLVIATLFGLVAAGAGSLGQTLARALAGRDRPPRESLVTAIGIGTAVLLVGIGNLDGAVQTWQRLTGSLDRFDFWRSSRATQFVITEFPYFSFLFADLHAHVIAMPLALMLLAVALATVLGAAGKTAGPAGPRHIPWPLVALAGLTLGAVAATNAWDVPAYAAVLAAAAFLAAPFARAAIVPRALWAGAGTLLIGGLAYGLYLPFFANFQSFYGSIGLTRIPTRLHELLNIWGYLLALTVIFIAVLLRSHLRSSGPARLSWPVVGLVLVAALATGAVVARGLWAPALIFPIIGLLGLLWLRNGLPPAGELTLVFLIGALCVIAGVEFVFIVDFLQGGEWYRMNTVFKLYLEAWLLLSVGLGGAAALVAREWPALPLPGRRASALIAGLGLAASLAYPLLVTPDRLRQRFEEQPAPTLNGLAFMEVGTLRDPAGATIRFDEDLAAIEWMQATFRGAPVIVEAMIGPYRGNGSRITNATGFPAVLGWDNHQAQQRWPDSIGPRAQDVRAIYTSTSPEQTLALLEKYDVDYVMVGQVERLTTLRRGHLGAAREDEPYASDEGLAILADLARAGALEEAFRAGDTVVYRVVRPLVFPGDTAAARPDRSSAATAGITAYE